ncbi:MAG TPA: site-2 protease family protein [Polyangiales bacterium]|nr:site-2 protease family protein [Polyangiales bacterium]
MAGFQLFSLAGVPVSVSPWYLLLLAYLAFGGPGFAQGMMLAACITVSLLAHEMGHALVARAYKLQPQVLLHGFGGLTGHERPKSNGAEALIVAAGPLAGLSTAGLSWLALEYAPITSPVTASLLSTMLWLNTFWSLFNLLPMWPMDGGQLMRLGAGRAFKPVRAERVTHITSIVVVLLVALASYKINIGGPMIMFILAITAWQNYQALSVTKTASAPARENPFARELIDQAEQAYERGDDDAAARLCHQLRSEGAVPPRILDRAWAILGVTATRKGEYEEALSYLRRAPNTPDVVEAKAQCHYQLGMFDALEALVQTKEFLRLPNDTRSDILAALSEKPA